MSMFSVCVLASTFECRLGLFARQHCISKAEACTRESFGLCVCVCVCVQVRGTPGYYLHTEVINFGATSLSLSI